jgi:arylsulfatase A-like enzyme
MVSEKQYPAGLINTDWDMNHHYLPLTPEQLQDEIDTYDGAIAYVDHGMGELLDGLEERGIPKNTVVIITADHGEMFGDHGYMGHARSLYLPENDVPLIVWQPALIPENIRLKKPVSLTSISTTVLDLAEVDANNSFPRPSLQPFWSYPPEESDLPAPLAEITQQTWVPKQDLSRYGWIKTIIAAQFQYIILEKYGEALYNIQIDPAEGQNLINDADATEIIYQIRIEFKDLMKSNSN